ncbi:MAG: hypothetical protein PHX78_02520 [bacterium]|nr:hypothetical protein [bacterium]
MTKTACGTGVNKEHIEVILRKDFKKFKIDESYVPYGAVVSRSNPYCVLKKIYTDLDFLLQNKFGRDPWGGGTEFGVLGEINESEYNIFINIDNPNISAREKNEVLRKTLLKVVSQDNKIYYIIPGYLAADLVKDVRYEKEILVEVIKKYFPKQEKLIQIGTLEEQDSLLIQVLNHLYPHIRFISVNLHESISPENRMDLFYFTDRAIFTLFKDWVPPSNGKNSTAEDSDRPEKEEYLIKNIFYKLYHFLKPEGKIITVSVDKQNFNTKKLKNFYNCIKEFGWWQLVQPFFKKIEISSVSGRIQKINEEVKKDHLNFQVFFGERVESKLDVPAIAERLFDLNLPGVPFTLVSNYKNSFTYLKNVLMILKDLIEGKDNGYLKGPTKIQRDELEIICTDMRDKKERFYYSIVSLIEKMDQIKQIERVIDPVKYQSLKNPLLDNLGILTLFNFTKEEIEEIILIITGHSAMSGVVSGKLQGTALNPITDKVLMVGKEFSTRQLTLLLDIVEKRILPDIKKSVSLESVKYLKKILDKRKISNDKEMIIFRRIMEEYYFIMENYFIPSKQVFELIKRDYLKSIAEFAAGVGGLMPAKMVERFSKLRREASDVIYNPGITWESIMEEKVTNMGGTFWMALRRLLRIYEILRMDPILMKELEEKTDFEIEAIAGYDREMIHEYHETRELIKIAREFRDKYYSEISFDRPFFYRSLFEKVELHGTGRIFPFLSARSGFKLLWIACHAAKNNFIDFNPMFLSENIKENKQKIKEIEDNLDLIKIEDLDFSFLEGVKTKLLAREDVIIFDTGLELRLNEKTDYLEFRYSNIFKSIDEMRNLMEIFKNKEVSFRNINYLLKLENCASVIQKYPLAYREEIRLLNNDRSDSQKILNLEKKVQLIEEVIEDIRKLFIHEIFSPKEIGSNISLMSKFCPKVLEIVLNEFLELRNIKSVRKEHIETVNEYIIRIAKKFQAIDTKTKSDFQDKTVFNRIAQDDFGEKTPISIEVSEKQLTQLEDIYDRLAMYPEVKRAMIVSILFFNIGKVPSLFKKYHKQIDFVVYPEAGVEALKREKILENLVDKNTEKLALFFIGQMGKLGQIIKGEYPLESLEELFSPKDKEAMGAVIEKIGAENLFTANTILCILIASSVSEGLMTYDLMERFFSYYRKGISIIKKEKTTLGILMDYIFDKGRRAFTVINKPGLYEEEDANGEIKNADDNEIEFFGREAYVLERLFAFRGSYNIFHDIVLEFHRKFKGELSFNENGMPEFDKQMLSFLKFLLYKQSFHSIGINSFTKQMQNAIGIYNEFKKMPDEARKYLLYAFIDRKEKSKFWLLERSTRTLNPETQLKIIIFALKAIDYRKKVAQRKKSPYISFFGLSKQVDCHYDFINKAMQEISYSEIINNSLIAKILKGKVSQGIRFKYGFVNGAVKISFYPVVDIREMLIKIKRIKNLRALENYFIKETLKIKQCEYSTYDYQGQLKDEFLKIKEEIKDDIVNSYLKRITSINLFRKGTGNILSESNHLLKRLEFIFHSCIKVGTELELSANHFALVRDAYEITKEKIRLSALKGIISYQKKVGNTKELNEFTKKCVLFINKNVRLFGMEISWELLNSYKQLRGKEMQ